jgi:hypothetical protein
LGWGLIRIDMAFGALLSKVVELGDRKAHFAYDRTQGADRNVSRMARHRDRDIPLGLVVNGVSARSDFFVPSPLELRRKLAIGNTNKLRH